MPIISGGGGGGAAGAISLIGNQTLTVAAATFDTNTILGGNIPSSFSHLRVYVYGRSDAATTGTALHITANNTGGTSYDYLNLLAASTGPSSAAHLTQAFISAGFIPGATATANIFGASIFDIVGYAGTVGFKPIMGYGDEPSDVDTQQRVEFAFGHFSSTAAVTRLAVVPASGNFIAGSRFSLYGLT